MSIFANVRMVLMQTSHPGNIGSAARAIKTMGLSRLSLVSPKEFPHPKALEMASGAQDILQNAEVFAHLADSLADCQLIVGTSARTRTIPWPTLTPRQFAELAAAEAPTTQIAVLFGCEQSGLPNEVLQRCHYHIAIPANPLYSSLNLAAAVQVIAYELRVAAEMRQTEVISEIDYATDAQVEGFYQHLAQLLTDLDFLNPKAPRQLLPRLRRLFNRVRLEQMEVNILRGILTAIAKSKET